MLSTRFQPQTHEIDGRDVEIQLMSWADSDAVLGFSRLLGDEDRLLLRMDLSERGSVAGWFESIDAGQRATLLAKREGALLGYSSLSLRGLNWFRHLADFRVVIEPRQRGCGIGRLLGSQMIEIAKRTDLHRLVAQVPRSQDRAREFFRQLGFQPQVLLPDWVMDASGETRDLALMTLDLRP